MGSFQRVFGNNSPVKIYIGKKRVYPRRWMIRGLFVLAIAGGMGAYILFRAMIPNGEAGCPAFHGQSQEVTDVDGLAMISSYCMFGATKVGPYIITELSDDGSQRIVKYGVHDLWGSGYTETSNLQDGRVIITRHASIGSSIYVHPASVIDWNKRYYGGQLISGLMRNPENEWDLLNHSYNEDGTVRHTSHFNTSTGKYCGPGEVDLDCSDRSEY